MPTHIDTLVCDDVRMETGKKMSIMGLYGSSIGVPSFPWRTSKLCILQRWSTLPEGATVKLQITLPGVHSPLIIRMTTGPSVPPALSSLVVNLEGFEVLERGDMIIETYFGDSSEPDHRHSISIGPKEELEV